MLTDVLSPAQRRVAYRVFKWLSFALGVAGLLTTLIVAPEYAKAVAVGLSVVSFLGTAIGAQAQANTSTEELEPAGEEFSDAASEDEVDEG